MANRIAAALFLVGVVAACTDDKPMAIEDARALDAGGSVTEMSCTGFIQLESKWFRRELPYIEPRNGPRFYVDGTDFQSLWGESDPQTDGTTLIYAAKVYHFADGTEQLGTAGHRGDPNSAQCVWVVPIRVES